MRLGESGQGGGEGGMCGLMERCLCVGFGRNYKYDDVNVT